jgi:hypothetical protein
MDLSPVDEPDASRAREDSRLSLLSSVSLFAVLEVIGRQK